MLFTVLHGLSGQSVEEVTASIVLLEEKIWKKSMQASPDVILHRIKTYSDGLWRVKMDDDYAGYLFCIRLDERDILENYSWDSITDYGKISKHTDNGNCIFGVSIGSAIPSVGGILMEHWTKAFDEDVYSGCERIYICSRIPSLSALEIDKYNLSKDSECVLRDRTVSLFMKYGFIPNNLIVDGYDLDEESLGYSLLLYRNRMNKGTSDIINKLQ